MNEEEIKMFVVSEDNEWIGTVPDLDDGELIDHVFEINYRYIVDVEAVKEKRVIKEYPNGGKDVEFVEVSPEEGHWVIEDLEGHILDWPVDEEMISSMDKYRNNVLKIDGYIYRQYTQPEKTEYLLMKTQAENEVLRMNLQQQLDASDFIAAKFVDRLLLLDSLDELPALIEEFRRKYKTSLEIRQTQRDEINQLRT